MMLMLRIVSTKFIREIKMRKIIFTIFLLNCLAISPLAENHPMSNKKQDWQFDGIFGKFDREAIQRGFLVYKEVCSACHSVNLLSFRNLGEIGYNENEIKAIASGYTVQDGPNDAGEMFERPAIPSDKIPSPYPNENAARAANNSAYPPDLSLMIKARKDGANYVYSLLTGFNETVPDHVKLAENMYYNPYFPGEQIAMAPPLSDGQVQYSDGKEATVDQMSKDVVNFLQWASEPEMEARKSMGIKVILYLLIFTILFFIAKKRMWKKIKL
jgi:ubiquinol-cytochrome c reductase cytochrome c1 subunit